MANDLIYLGIGGNLLSDTYGPPRSLLGAALEGLDRDPALAIKAFSPWYESAPVPVSDQPWFVNGVIALESTLAPDDLLGRLLALEERFGRVRSVKNAARTLDIDILAIGDHILDGGDRLTVPHPRMQDRAFVLKPLADIAPNWCHPVSKVPIIELISQLDPAQDIRKMPDGKGLFGTEWPGGLPSDF